jgi:hypothetical protein
MATVGCRLDPHRYDVCRYVIVYGSRDVNMLTVKQSIPAETICCTPVTTPL